MPSLSFTLPQKEVGDVLTFILEKTQVLAGLSQAVQQEVVKQANDLLKEQGVDVKRDNVNDPEMYKVLKTAIRDALVAVMTNTVAKADPGLKNKIGLKPSDTDTAKTEEEKKEEIDEVLKEGSKLTPKPTPGKDSDEEDLEEKNKEKEEVEEISKEEGEEGELAKKNSPKPGSKKEVVMDEEGNVILTEDQVVPAAQAIVKLTEEISMGEEQKLKDEGILQDLGDNFSHSSPRPTPQ